MMEQGAIATTDGHDGNKNFLMEVIREGEATMVKPAEETEKGVYFLSNLDKNAMLMFKTVYFYPPAPGRGNEEAVEVVRESLAKVLVPYHPMAGRLAVGNDGRLVVELTGEGVAFAVAHADFELRELLAAAPHPPESTLLKLVYDLQGSLLEIPLMTVQVTKFKCRGFAVGVCTNHCLADGVSTVEFHHSWGHVARHGLPLPTAPFLDRSILKARDPPRANFPHVEFLGIDDVSGCGALYGAEQPFQSRAFVFDGERIGRLKGAAMAEGGPIKCSSFEVLSAFVWRAWSSALGMSSHQRTKLIMVVDGRSRFNPTLPNRFFGNAISSISALSDAGELQGEPLSSGVKRVQEAIGMASDEYMRSAIDYLETTRVAPSCLNATLVISAWSRLSFHSMDFGWGEAVYSGPVELPTKAAALFLSHGTDQEDISVYLELPRSAMDTFHRLVMEI